MATELHVTRGLPGSGKSTWARRQPLWRVNRDDLRAMSRAESWPYGDPYYEGLLTAIQHAQVGALLDERISVVVDDTNLSNATMWALDNLARDHMALLLIHDFTPMPLEVCIERDKLRPSPVGEAVIRQMWAGYLANPKWGGPIVSRHGAE